MAIINIPELFLPVAAVVNAKFSTRGEDPFSVFFDYGHYIEVTRNLIQKENSISQKDKKYPLIWLVMDFPERFDRQSIGYCQLPRLDFIIAVPTEPELSTPERITKNFKPRLYPIYEAFMNAIVTSNIFYEQSLSELEYEKIDRPYWGGQDSNGNGQANLFNDKIDAVQIRGLKLTVINSLPC